jgi:hypothetical protein
MQSILRIKQRRSILRASAKKLSLMNPNRPRTKKPLRNPKRQQAKKQGKQTKNRQNRQETRPSGLVAGRHG